MYNSGVTNPSGVLTLRRLPTQKLVTLNDIIKRGLPSKSVQPFVNDWRRANLMKLLRGAYKVWLAEQIKAPTHYGALYLTLVKPTFDPTELLKEYVDLLPTLGGLDFTTWASRKGMGFLHIHLGLAGTRVVTTAGVNFITDAFQNTTELENLKYHALGTGSTGEGVGETALVTELTTEYTGNVRATGTTTEGASANIYRTVATNTLDGTPGAALREHGILDQAATGGGTLLDRTLFAAITLSSGDGLQSTYDFTSTAGS